MSDQQLLSEYVEVWWQAINDFTELLEELDESDWATPTDLPGWDVKAVASHIAHLESRLAGQPEESADVGEPPHVTGMMGLYTEIGVVNRREASPDAIINEIRSAATARHTALLADPPTDPAAKPEPIFGGVPWDWRTLLRNRPLDVWMHEQDIRRAVDRPGGMDSAAARHTADYLAEALGYVVAKRVGAPAGTTVVLELDGSSPFAFGVDESGRGERLPDLPAEPAVLLRMEREAFIRLAGGRCLPDPGTVEVVGDEELARRILDAMATTP
ncbi:maleylpyruvate isomerase family mycothiol-dependent enzyme [Nocardioides sp. YIM 152315]|uniref:maleylpyruvate isomerase family mycothiol-dependent enzyme n=1 Tax=Nocardioides sp. YIM 152315 TaxID=3031760 RepID=UPI0023DA739A|nr:maleylpyruvate isomerase family mycothiol-dependent enzyme [Nocardioides sp. YIM 152315]MDF1603274.1 maleylpyruvate isomerase family mycothiol-dependent enzyme [Nocardioides sp. YIM 152315]